MEPPILNHKAHEAHEAHEEASTEDLARAVVDCGLKVHKSLGPGLLESIYEHCMIYELQRRDIPCRRQVVLPVVYDGMILESAFKLDIVVNDVIVIEIKAVESLSRLHESQLLTYLKFSGFKLGFLMNFNVSLFKTGLRRMVL